ncbi:MAG: hypothetical protein ACRDHF_00960 [Tepidiformaceae bacterium]
MGERRRHLLRARGGVAAAAREPLAPGDRTEGAPPDRGPRQGGDERAGRAIVLALHRLYRVLNDWRSERAVKTVLDSAAADFALVYGAAHGESLLHDLRKASYREVDREWHTVFTL